MNQNPYYTVISRNNATLNVLVQLRLDVILRRYSKGEALRETKLTQRYQCSRSAIRESFLVMEKEGLVRTLSNGRKIAEPPEIEDIYNIYALREHIELTSINRIFESNHQNINPMMDAAKEIIASDGLDADQILLIDNCFHRSIVAAGKDKALLQAWENLSGIMLAIFHLNMLDSEYYQQEFVNNFKTIHISLMTSLMQNFDESSFLMKQHIDEARDISVRVIKRILDKSDIS